MIATYRALELGPLATVFLDNIVGADIRAGELLAPSLAGASDGAISVFAVTVCSYDIVQEATAAPATRLRAPLGLRCAAATTTRWRSTRLAGARPGPTRRTIITALARMGQWLERLSKSRPLAGLNRTLAVIAVFVAITIDLCRDDPHINGHVVSQILVPCNEGCPIFILEADAACDAVVDAVEILDRRHDRVRGVMRENLYSHGDSGSNFGVLVQEKFESDVLWRRIAG